MLRKLRPRSAYDVMAAIAFFIAIAGGSAYAAATIGSSDIKNDAVRSNHIKNGQVKKLKEPVRLSTCCAPASKIFRCCSNSSRFSISFMTAAFHLVPIINNSNNSRPAAFTARRVFSVHQASVSCDASAATSKCPTSE